MYAVAKNHPMQMSALLVTKQVSEKSKITIKICLRPLALHLAEPVTG
jgi:hypothetical protein